MTRGDIVTVAPQGDLGKPRPALIVQSDLFDRHPSVVLLTITSDVRALPLFRVPVEPSAANGLVSTSDVMIDKPQAVGRDKVCQVIGRADARTMTVVDRLMALFLGVV